MIYLLCKDYRVGETTRRRLSDISLTIVDGMLDYFQVGMKGCRALLASLKFIDGALREFNIGHFQFRRNDYETFLEIDGAVYGYADMIDRVDWFNAIIEREFVKDRHETMAEDV